MAEPSQKKRILNEEQIKANRESDRQSLNVLPDPEHQKVTPRVPTKCVKRSWVS